MCRLRRLHMIIYMEMVRDFRRIVMRRVQERICIEEYLSFFFGLVMQMLMELNRYRQQAILSLAQTPSDMFQGNGYNSRTLGKSFLFLISLISSQSIKQGSNTGQI